MDGISTQEWRCPQCETVNTEDVCVVCGAKREQTSNTAIPTGNNTIDTIHAAPADTSEAASSSKWWLIIGIGALVIALVIVAIWAIATAGDQGTPLPDDFWDDVYVDDPAPEEIPDGYWEGKVSADVKQRLDIARVEINGGYDYGTAAEFGLNALGERVFWELHILVKDDSDEIDSVQTSWTDRVAYSSTYADDWESALQGNTHWWAYSTYDYDDFYDGIGIVLPDDPGIAGKQYLIINGVKIAFTLEYFGDYSTGLGWDISNITISLDEE